MRLRRPHKAKPVASQQPKLTAAEADVWGQLYRKHLESVRAYLRYATRNELDVDDLVSETFLKVWQTYGTRAGDLAEDELERLLITIAKSCVTDRWRRDSRMVLWEDYAGPDTDTEPTTIEAFDEVLGNQIVSRFFIEASGRLTKGEWRVAFMTWAMGESDSDIAHELKTTVATVRTQRSSALKKIRAYARRDGFEIAYGDSAADQGSSTHGIGEVTV